MCNIEKDVLDNIDPDAVLEDLHQEMADDGFFKRHWSIIVLFEIIIIVILLFF